MISDLGLVLQACLDVFKIEFTMYGFSFSLWQVFVLSTLVGIVAWFLSEVLLGD